MQTNGLILEDIVIILADFVPSPSTEITVKWPVVPVQVDNLVRGDLIPKESCQYHIFTRQIHILVYPTCLKKKRKNCKPPEKFLSARRLDICHAIALDKTQSDLTIRNRQELLLLILSWRQHPMNLILMIQLKCWTVYLWAQLILKLKSSTIPYLCCFTHLLNGIITILIGMNLIYAPITALAIVMLCKQMPS